MTTYTIKPLKMGEFTEHEKSSILYLVGCGVKLRTPITMWLVQGGGKNIIVDTGLSDPEYSAKYQLTPMYQTEEMKPLNALKREGLTPDDIDFVVNTHLHWDHCWNNDLFKGKKIYVQKAELEFAENSVPAQYTIYEAEQVGMWPRWKDALESIVPVEGDLNLCDGIDLILIPSHTPGSQGVLVNTEKGKYFIAGDVIGSYENWEGNAEYGNSRLPFQPIMPAIHVDLNACYEAFARIKELADYVLPGHDPRVYDHMVYPPQD